jgi:uncharacterized protein YndB with AHSA1/START domain
MKNQDFTTTVAVDTAPSEVFNAVNNVRGWWSENIDGDTDKLSSEFLYHYQDVHRAKIKVIEIVPDKKVVWHVVDNYFKFTKDESEWKDTNVIFEISEKEGKTQLKFTHQGLVPDYECFQICHDAWTHYIQGSLTDLIMKGKGSPTPRDLGETQTHEKQEPAGRTTLKSICHRLLIEAPVEKVYGALTTQEGLAGWWTPETTARPEVGSVSRFTFADYFKEMKVEELKAYSKVKWLCVKAYEDWIGTTITFELEPNKKGSVLFFHHDGWKEYTQEFASCSYDWAIFLRSLKFLCETGKGLPYPDFRK